ncbi:DNA-directed DNA polymerase epsilon, subunit B [Monascus purpureus]|uniref:DNA polymerase epsilon subunit B n=1 Tax=Monascus purpureus TaxID=5098 RepID=A0A507R079_MONPU|nr:DNA-directed DNA polymerase epsilon, subunit B [Monascus purpureus]BDD63800.1 hypothetical protein MAP00_008660 [Monascus purpureus]
MEETSSTARAPDARQRTASDSIPSSSPGFGTPARPFKPRRHSPLVTKASILPILLPPSTLRPVAFRTFTRKHNLTISSTALQTLATFVGKNCGTGWREEGLAERVLDEVAKAWKKAGGGVIVEEGKGASLKDILHTLEGSMSGGRIISGKSSDRGTNIASDRNVGDASVGLSRNSLQLALSPSSEDNEEDPDLSFHPRSWIKAIGAFDIPRLAYNVGKKYFETAKLKPTLLPPSFHKTNLFRDRYNLVHQRLLRNESFQTSFGTSGVPSLRRSASTFATQQCYKLTQIANLLGRSGTSHLLLGLLSISPTGDLSLTDLTGSVALDLDHARIVPEDGAWFTPGMIVLVEGVYEEGDNISGSTIGGNSGVGGAIGGRFIGASICGPPCERRDVSLGTGSQQSTGDISSSGGFGWVDFLGVGSERAQGSRMRKIEAKCLKSKQGGTGTPARLKVAIMSEISLDDMKTFDALRKIFGLYNSLPLDERPVVYVMMGNFAQTAVINGSGRSGSVEYKEYFDSLALTLSDFPSILQHSTFIFVPGDKDPWASTFSAGAASTIPRRGIPELFTSRVKRAFATANSGSERSHSTEPVGEAIWSSNPSRLTFFGPLHDIAIFRDDISGRLRRNAVILRSEIPESDFDTEMLDASNSSLANASSTASENPIEPLAERRSTGLDTPPNMLMARKLVKTVLDQGTMSPFPLSVRPVLWDHASALQLYPLPTAFVLADAEAPPCCITYEGCHVMNPGRLIPEGDLSTVKWVEYDVLKNRGRVREEHY